jgi:hypothetical protein
VVGRTTVVQDWCPTETVVGTVTTAFALAEVFVPVRGPSLVVGGAPVDVDEQLGRATAASSG